MINLNITSNIKQIIIVGVTYTVSFLTTCLFLTLPLREWSEARLAWL